MRLWQPPGLLKMWRRHAKVRKKMSQNVFDVFDLKVIKNNCKRPAGGHMLVLWPRKLVLLYVLNSSTITTSASPLP